MSSFTKRTASSMQNERGCGCLILTVFLLTAFIAGVYSFATQMGWIEVTPWEFKPLKERKYTPPER